MTSADTQGTTPVATVPGDTTPDVSVDKRGPRGA
ncbi:MAG: hypothetical protein QOG22_1015, partial [Pseudonocardiales bacterium]|nr:hypothetical protein [Pseudonocardiales bacterium]